MGAVVPGANVTLLNEQTKLLLTAIADQNGVFTFPSLANGTYTLEIKVTGFALFKVDNVVMRGAEALRLTALLTVDSNTAVVGLLGIEEPSIDMKSSAVKTVITREMMDRIPH